MNLKINSIRSKLILLTVSLTVITIIILTVFNIIALRDSSRQQLKAEISNIAAVVSDQIDAALLFEDYAVLGKRVDSLLKNGSILLVCLYRLENQDTKLVYHSYSENCQCDLSKPLKEDEFFIAEFIESNKQKIGELHIIASYDRAEFYTRKGAIIIIFITFFISTSLLYYMFYAQKTITEPIVALSKSVRGFAKDQKQFERIKKVSSDEVGDLVDSFNAAMSLIESQTVTISNHSKNLEKKIKERTESLVKTTENLKSFTHSVSHDLSAPLRHAEGYLYLVLENEMNLNSDQKMLLGQVQESHGRMFELIDSFLALSEAVSVEMTLAVVNLTEIANEIVSKFRSVRPEIYIDYLAQPNLYACANGPLIRILLNNLIDNAIKYRKLESRVDIQIGAYFDNGEEVFFVKDNGLGFEAENSNELFKTFARMDYKVKGYGVGLATVQRIVERHKGRIWAESSKLEGSAFHFTLNSQKKDR